jgi:hypothetical protein
VFCRMSVNLLKGEFDAIVDALMEDCQLSLQTRFGWQVLCGTISSAGYHLAFARIDADGRERYHCMRIVLQR